MKRKILWLLLLNIIVLSLFFSSGKSSANSPFSCIELQKRFKNGITISNFSQKRHTHYFSKWYRHNLLLNQAEDCLLNTAKLNNNVALMLSRYLLFQTQYSKSVIFGKKILKQLMNISLSKNQKNTALYLLQVLDWFSNNLTAYKQKAKYIRKIKSLKKSVFLKNLSINRVYTPFREKRRRSFRSIKKRFASGYGEYRGTYKRGHKHSGLDLWGRFGEKVYAVGPGMVYNIHLGFPHRTVVVLHFQPNGKYFYSVYKHVEKIKVKTNQWVDKNTEIGRLFTKREMKKARFTVNHLHFEIRKNFDDLGSASWTSMTMRKLNRHFRDPMKFFKKQLQ